MDLSKIQAEISVNVGYFFSATISVPCTTSSPECFTLIIHERNIQLFSRVDISQHSFKFIYKNDIQIYKNDIQTLPVFWVKVF